MTYLELPAGVHRFGFITDDGYKIATSKLPITAGAAPLAFHNGGPANETVDFVVAQAGLYPFRMVWYERGGAGHAEWTSIDIASGNRLLVNGSEATAIKAWAEYEASAETFVVESSASVSGPYTPDATANVDSASKTVTVPAGAGPRFFRLRSGAAVLLKSPRIQGGNLTFVWQ